MLCEVRVFHPSDIIAKGFQGTVSAVGTDCNAETEFRSLNLTHKLMHLYIQ